MTQTPTLPTVYCRDKLGGAFDYERVIHHVYGHAPHTYEHNRRFRAPKTYQCPGIVHTHYRDKDLGVIEGPTGDILVVIRCECGHEYTRPLNERL